MDEGGTCTARHERASSPRNHPRSVPDEPSSLLLRQAVAANLEHSQQMSAFNAQMESSGGGGMMQVNTEEGPTRTEDDGTKGYSWEQSDEVIPRNDPPRRFHFRRSETPRDGFRVVV